MIKSLFGWRVTALSVIVTAIAAAPAQARELGSPLLSGLSTVDTSTCMEQAFSQPFASFGDNGYYTPMPGQSADDFAGTGWTLSGGASVETTTLYDGSSGQVLDLPAGSSATSPPMCVGSNYPFGRTMVRDVAGSDGVNVSVSYEGSRTSTRPRESGQVNGIGTDWTLSDRFNLQPYHTTGWQIVRVHFAPADPASDYQLYNIYVDPRMMK